MNADHFYDQLAPYYHLIFKDWEASIGRQARALDAIMRKTWPDSARDVLDVACGIGTQALGLAALGYRVTGSDFSAAQIDRARSEATQRGLDIAFSVADMRTSFDHHQRQFDVVLAVDNAVPHLLSDDAIVQALRQFYQCTRPGGGCLITLRDYDREPQSGIHVKPYGVRVENGTRYLLFQVWEFSGRIYELSLYLVTDDGQTAQTQVMRADYYAISPVHLMALLREAGFSNVRRLDDAFYQPVLVGTREVG